MHELHPGWLLPLWVVHAVRWGMRCVARVCVRVLLTLTSRPVLYAFV